MGASTNAYDSLYREQSDDDWLDSNTTARKNQWTTSETIFYHEQGKGERLEELKELNEGKYEGDRMNTLLRSMMIQDIETFCNILEMPDEFTETIKIRMKSLDGELNKFGGSGYEKIVLVVINLVHDAQLGEECDLHDRIIYNESYKNLMDSVGMTSGERRQLRNSVRKKIDAIGAT